MSASYVKRFVANPYGWRVYLFLDRAKWARYVSRATKTEHTKRLEEAEDSDGVTLIWKEAQALYIGVFDGEPGTLAHEAVHATNYMLANAGIKLSTADDEGQAYMVAFIVDQCIVEVLRSKK